MEKTFARPYYWMTANKIQSFTITYAVKERKRKKVINFQISKSPKWRNGDLEKLEIY